MNTYQAHNILQSAVDTYAPSHVFAMFSGGYDSLVTARITAQHPQFAGCVHINTGTGIPATREYVYDVCRQFGWPLKEYQSDEADSYENWVLKGGFPGPAQHSIMFNRLKDRGIAKLIREHKRHRHDTIVLSAGARQIESIRRMGQSQEVRRDKARVWVNPIYHWSKDDVLDYKAIHNLPSNPVVDLLHRSGECNCGCYAQEQEREMFRLFYPQFHDWLTNLEQRVADAGFPWRWGEAPPSWFQQQKAGQEALFDFLPLCASCMARQEAV